MKIQWKMNQKEKRMRKRILVCAFIVICFSMVAYSTVAYFTYEDKSTNVITMGNIKIDLQEYGISDEGAAPIPFEGALNVLPGLSVSRTVQVKNVGAQPAWIRISVTKSITLAEGTDGEADLSLVSLDLNNEDWTEKDGYFYYKESLLPGETTKPLFTRVSFASDMGNLYQNSKATIKVNAQGTQVVHNGSTVLEAVGWPDAQQGD